MDYHWHKVLDRDFRMVDQLLIKYLDPKTQGKQIINSTYIIGKIMKIIVFFLISLIHENFSSQNDYIPINECLNLSSLKIIQIYLDTYYANA